MREKAFLFPAHPPRYVYKESKGGTPLEPRQREAPSGLPLDATRRHRAWESVGYGAIGLRLRGFGSGWAVSVGGCLRVGVRSLVYRQGSLLAFLRPLALGLGEGSRTRGQLDAVAVQYVGDGQDLDSGELPPCNGAFAVAGVPLFRPRGDSAGSLRVGHCLVMPMIVIF